MQNLLNLSLPFALILGTIAVGTGAQARSIPVPSDVDANVRILFPVQGEIGQVEAQSAESPAEGLWTNVTINYNVACTQKIESVVASYIPQDDGSVDVLFSALASTQKKVKGLVCQSISVQSKTIAIPGIVTADALHLVNLPAATTDIPKGTITIGKIADGEVLATRSLCPEGAFCLVGGTIATIAFDLKSCVNAIGPVARHVDQKDDGSAVITLHAVELESNLAPLVDCATTRKKVELSLPGVFASVEDLQLRLLK